MSRENRLMWLAEPLEELQGYMVKAMFGAKGCYAHGMLVLVLSDRDEPWNGVLVPTEREFHASLIIDIPALRQHPVLGKWLYVPENDDDFESAVSDVVELIVAVDPRIGVEPKPRKT
ncbi:hypothetical protein ACFLZI_01870 [Nitrospirota bacterium]